MKQLIRWLFLLIFTIQSSIAQYQERQFKQDKKYVVKQWEILDVVLQAETIENPFTDTSSALFTNSLGEKQEVPLIYNGGNNSSSEWLLRFSGETIGTWQFIVKSKYSSLNEKKEQ